MLEALAEAELGRGRTHPNPVVGALVVSRGKVIARGHHERAGGPHAGRLLSPGGGSGPDRGADAYTAAAVAGTGPQQSEHGARARRWVWPAAAGGLLIVLGLLVLFRADKRFDGYVASAGGTQEHVVREGQHIDLIFVDRRRAGTRYTVVYKHLDYPRARTYHGRTKGVDTLSRIRVRAGTAARIDVRWYVAGKSRARWTFDIRPRRASADRPAA